MGGSFVPANHESPRTDEAGPRGVFLACSLTTLLKLVIVIIRTNGIMHFRTDSRDHREGRAAAGLSFRLQARATGFCEGIGAGRR
jgi:hypothetical protein